MIQKQKQKVLLLKENTFKLFIDDVKKKTVIPEKKPKKTEEEDELEKLEAEMSGV